MAAAKKNIGELLVVENMVTHAQIEEARKEAKNVGGRLSSALIKLGHMSDRKMAEFLGQKYSVPSIDLDQFEIDEEALKCLNGDICIKHCVIPVSKSGNVLVVAFADPSNFIIRDDLQYVSKCKIEVVVAPENSILRAIDKSYSKKQELTDITADLENMEDAFTNVGGTAQILEKDPDYPLIKFVNTMLTEAIKLKASDIHIEPYEKRLRVRYRIDGNLYEKSQPPSGVGVGLASRIKVMSKLDIAERRRPQDGRIKIKTVTGHEVDFRVSVLPTLFGEKIVMRILDKANLKVDMTQLGFEDDELEIFKARVADPQGIVLVTGPTGSGKTTTLYSALQSLNDSTVNISTAEDPVEFNLDGINQVQVNSDIDFNFPEALRSFLRQDPDIILVGEIRDLETAEIAFKAANTGHLVLSTLHTNDAAATISRLVDMGVAPFLITTTLNLIVAQRLAGRVCKRCAVPHKVEIEVLVAAGMTPADAAQARVMKGEGCPTCNGSGIKGRVAIFEVMPMSTNLREMILKGGTTLDIKSAAIKAGMRTLRQSALRKMKLGLVPLDNVVQVTLSDGEA